MLHTCVDKSAGYRKPHPEGLYDTSTRWHRCTRCWRDSRCGTRNIGGPRRVRRHSVLLRSEQSERTDSDWHRGAEKDEHFAYSESPRYVGRGIAALAADANAMEKSGTVTSSWNLAREYGFTDIDGTRPNWGQHAAGQGFGASERASHERFVGQFRI